MVQIISGYAIKQIVWAGWKWRSVNVQCVFKNGFVWSNCWMNRHFIRVMFITLQRKIWFRPSSKFSCTWFMFEKKKKAIKRWVFQSSVSIGVYANTVKQRPLPLFYPGGQSIHSLLFYSFYNDHLSAMTVAMKLIFLNIVVVPCRFCTFCSEYEILPQ